jgi:hypothetical protein
MSRRIEGLVSQHCSRFKWQVAPVASRSWLCKWRQPADAAGSTAANYTNRTPANGIFRFAVSKKLQIYAGLTAERTALSAGFDRNRPITKKQ